MPSIASPFVHTTPSKYRIERNHKPEADEEHFLKKLEGRFNEKFEARVGEILEKMNSESKEHVASIDDIRKLESNFEREENKLEPDERKNKDEAALENKPISTDAEAIDTKFEGNHEIDGKIEFVLDSEALMRRLKDNPSEYLMDRVMESMENDYERLEKELVRELPEKYPEPSRDDSTWITEAEKAVLEKQVDGSGLEDANKPNHSGGSLEKATTEDPLAYDLEADIEALYNELEAEKLEPEIEEQGETELSY